MPYMLLDQRRYLNDQYIPGNAEYTFFREYLDLETDNLLVFLEGDIANKNHPIRLRMAGTAEDEIMAALECWKRRQVRLFRARLRLEYEQDRSERRLRKLRKEECQRIQAQDQLAAAQAELRQVKDELVATQATLHRAKDELTNERSLTGETEGYFLVPSLLFRPLGQSLTQSLCVQDGPAGAQTPRRASSITPTGAPAACPLAGSTDAPGTQRDTTSASGRTPAPASGPVVSVLVFSWCGWTSDSPRFTSRTTSGPASR